MSGIGQAPPLEWPSGGTSGQTLTKTGSADTAVGWVSSPATTGFPGSPVSGRWYPANSRYNGSFSGQIGLTGGYLYFAPFLTVGMTCAGLGVTIGQIISTPTITMSLWTSNSLNEPGTLLATAPSASVSNYSGVFASPVALDAGLYWIASYNTTDCYYYGVSLSDSAGSPNTYMPSHWNGSPATPSPSNTYPLLKTISTGSSPGNNPAVAVYSISPFPTFWVKAG